MDKEWIMLEGPFPTSKPKGVLMNAAMIDEEYLEEVGKLEIGEASQIFTRPCSDRGGHFVKQFVFLRTR